MKNQSNDRGSIHNSDHDTPDAAANKEVTTLELTEPGQQAVNVVSREDVPPDGGYGWICAACVFFINAHTWGVNSVSTRRCDEIDINCHRHGLFSCRITSKIRPFRAQRSLNLPSWAVFQSRNHFLRRLLWHGRCEGLAPKSPWRSEQYSCLLVY